MFLISKREKRRHRCQAVATVFCTFRFMPLRVPALGPPYLPRTVRLAT